MSASTTAARLAFFGFGEPTTPAPTPSPTRAAVDASVGCAAPPCEPPEKQHRVHWRFVVTGGRTELRLTTYRGALWLRPWVRNDASGVWWPMKGARPMRLSDREAPAFADAVAKAAEHLARET